MIKKLTMTAIVLSLLVTGIAMSSTVFAQSTTVNDPMTNIVQKIADKFGLKKEDVQAVFDQERAERKSQIEEQYVAKLTQAVKDGKLTETQKQLLINKHTELSAQHQQLMLTMEGKTFEERKTAIEANRTQRQRERKSLEEWATQNGIDVTYLMGGFDMHGRKGMGMRGK